MKFVFEFIAILILDLIRDNGLVLSDASLVVKNTKGRKETSGLADIRLVGRNADGGIGTVQIKERTTWKAVCRKGNDPTDQTFGSNEAKVACRHLGYLGGWVAETGKADRKSAAMELVDDFRCSWDERRLDKCYYDRKPFRRRTMGCGVNNNAGVRCYSSFDVRLVGGAKPNAGRVQSKYDNKWTDVCFSNKKKTRRGPSDWGFHEARVVCKELGYPGVMMKQRGGYGDAKGHDSIHGFNCLGNERSLQDCLSRPPESTSKGQRYSCGARNEAVVICADPGYTGCFMYVDFPEGVVADRLTSHTMTVRLCRDYCRQNHYLYAALYEGSVCYCGTKDFLDYIVRVPDSKCRDPCGGNDHEICGGFNVLSVYNAQQGMCMDPYNQSNSYYFGDIVSDLQCEANLVMRGVPEVQCIMGEWSNITKWSGAFPFCQEINEEALATSRLSLNCLWIAIACVSFLAAAVIIVAEITIGGVFCHTNNNLFGSGTASSKQLTNRLCSIRRTITESFKAPSEHIYESRLRAASSLFDFYYTKVQYRRSLDLPLEHDDTGTKKHVSLAESEESYHIDNARRALFRTSDDDVVAYIVRTKL